MIEDLITFVQLLLFLTVVPLTSTPIDVNGQFEIVPEKPIKALNNGAFVAIDVSRGASIDDLRITQVRTEIKRQYPLGSIEAMLYSKGESIVQLNYASIAVFQEDGSMKARIMLTNPAQMPVGIEFDRVEISSVVPLRDVDIYWINGAR